LRILGFLITISVPAIYVALTTFHQEVIPTPLILGIYAARQTIPFPTVIEILIMLVIFEILRETGERAPAFMGQALTIVGALVLGQSAVDARFISSPILIVTALAGITGLMIPKLKGAIIILRFIFVFFAAFLGLYGLIIAITGLFIHLCELHTFGVPYMSYTSFLDIQDLKDTDIRAPWWYLNNRPGMITVNKVRSKLRRSGKS
jgi:spore germination protein KA